GPLRVGETISQLSRIIDVGHKLGRGGPLVFVVVRPEVSDRQDVAVIEEPDGVYRDSPKPTDPAPSHQTPPSRAERALALIHEPRAVTPAETERMCKCGPRARKDRWPWRPRPDWESRNEPSRNSGRFSC